MSEPENTMIPKTTITMTHLFLGAPSGAITCEVGTVAEIREEISKRAVGGGWGLSVMIPRELADRLGIYELLGGGLGVGGEPLVEGSILDRHVEVEVEG